MMKWTKELCWFLLATPIKTGSEATVKEDSHKH